jgi:hypothetical protein
MLRNTHLWDTVRPAGTKAVAIAMVATKATTMDCIFLFEVKK